jgi:hypothetical protein
VPNNSALHLTTAVPFCSRCAPPSAKAVAAPATAPQPPANLPPNVSEERVLCAHLLDKHLGDALESADFLLLVVTDFLLLVVTSVLGRPRGAEYPAAAKKQNALLAGMACLPAHAHRDLRALPAAAAAAREAPAPRAAAKAKARARATAKASTGRTGERGARRGSDGRGARHGWLRSLLFAPSML